jgi:hypothetical protein
VTFFPDWNLAVSFQVPFKSADLKGRAWAKRDLKMTKHSIAIELFIDINVDDTNML